jgi:hypothetical protein
LEFTTHPMDSTDHKNDCEDPALEKDAKRELLSELRASATSPNGTYLSVSLFATSRFSSARGSADQPQ